MWSILHRRVCCGAFLNKLGILYNIQRSKNQTPAGRHDSACAADRMSLAPPRELELPERDPVKAEVKDSLKQIIEAVVMRHFVEEQVSSTPSVATASVHGAVLTPRMRRRRRYWRSWKTISCSAGRATRRATASGS